jgi:hypothetical protein
MGYPSLVDDINDDNELSIILAVVDKCNSPDLNEPLERLNKEDRERLVEEKNA